MAVLVGLPALLVAVGGNPFPVQVPDLEQVRRALTAPDDGRLVLAAAVLAGWVCWAMLVGATVLEVVDQVRSLRRTVRAPAATHPRQGSAGGLGVPRSLMRPLVASILAVLVSAPTPAGLSTGPAAAQLTATGPEVPGTVGPGVPDTSPAPFGETLEQLEGTEEVPAAATHTVQPGDTLWDIAEDHLGAGERYPEVYTANNDQLTSPHLIYPGTVLVLPSSVGTVTGPEVTEVVVAPGDTLSGLAAEHLGDPDRWPEIYDASTDTLQDSSARLDDPDLIHPGWRLHIPAESTARHDSHQHQPMSPQQPSDAAAAATSHTRTPQVAATDGAAAGQHVGVTNVTPMSPAVSGSGGDTTPAGGKVTADLQLETAEEDVDPARLPDAAWLVAGLAGAGVPWPGRCGWG
ncbi:LysM peptidoglycan-binding domain-containing protein [uncultured Serinicoccus sp.]|uniref:LysM peptidoglycan-binding domain-containing protein n=1 Tax=uncultured Serinicoccus sp. TaxID=735514 RepID=UPI00261A48FD|nr:LysM peptidoglycan-binding domain-containing protein [uncultured Serinicoccus sp.]